MHVKYFSPLGTYDSQGRVEKFVQLCPHQISSYNNVCDIILIPILISVHSQLKLIPISVKLNLLLQVTAPPPPPLPSSYPFPLSPAHPLPFPQVVPGPIQPYWRFKKVSLRRRHMLLKSGGDPPIFRRFLF